MIVLLLGGARSGKSTLALAIAAREVAPVHFIATAEAGDDEMRARIATHRAERPSEWSTTEAPLAVAEALNAAPPSDTVILDCLTLWVANLLAAEVDVNSAAQNAATIAATRSGLTVVVTNEVGLGLVPANPLGRRYRDSLGRTNAIFADAAPRAYLVVAGRAIPLPRFDD